MDRKSFIAKISDSFNDGELSLFLGAGSSLDAHFPTWKELLTPCAEKLGLDISSIKDYFQLAQYFINEYSERELYSLINQKINKFDYESELMKIIVQIGFKSIWTTNFDKVIEKNFEYQKININSIHDEQDLGSVSLKNRVNIFKLNGDIGSISKIVISKSDIENYYLNHELFLSFFQRELVTNTFLFIGYSFTDDIVLKSIQKLHSYIGKNNKAFYTIMIDKPGDKNFQLFIDDLGKRYNIKVLLVQTPEDIKEILREIKEKTISKNIYISGSLDDALEETRAYNLSKSLVEKLIDGGYNIVTGFGKNIGYYISGSSIQKLYSINEANIEKRLIMRPFAHDMSLDEDTSYRRNLISDTKFTIVMYGQAINSKGDIVTSRGVWEEIKISKEQGNYIIPIASTGFAAAELGEKIKSRITEYPYLENYIEKLCSENNPDKLAELVLHIIKEISFSFID